MLTRELTLDDIILTDHSVSVEHVVKRPGGRETRVIRAVQVGGDVWVV